jgi:hypothetical protein
VGEGPKPEDVPPPVKQVAVRVLPTLLGGFRPVSATRLSPEPLLQEPVAIRAVEGAWQLDVPEVALWNILIINLER